MPSSLLTEHMAGVFSKYTIYHKDLYPWSTCLFEKRGQKEEKRLTGGEEGGFPCTFCVWLVVEEHCGFLSSPAHCVRSVSGLFSFLGRDCASLDG